MARFLLSLAAAAWVCGVGAFLVRSSRGRAVAPCGQRSLLCSASPIKTGTHTYASWRNTEDDEGADWPDEELEELEELEEDEEELDDGENEEYAAKGRRSSGRINNAEGSNPFIDWVRKLYDSVFFYGLDAQIPQGGRRQSKGGNARRRVRLQRGSKKSMFMTPTESIGEDYLSSLAQEKDAVAANVQSKSRATLLRRMQVLDECIKGINIDLAVVETALSGDAAGPAERQELARQRKNILEAIENMQVQYVALCAENDES